MSVLSNYTTATRPSASSNTGLCIFNTDNGAIEVSDGTDYLTYLNDGGTFTSNTHSALFEGTNYIDISGASGLLNSATALSMSAWYYMDALNAPIVSGGESATDGCWIYNSASSNNLVFAVRNGDHTAITTPVPSTGQWVHVAATYNAGSGTLYVTPLGGSTTTVSSSTLPTSLSSTAGSDLSIGRLAPGIGSAYHNGKIDEVVIWNREITSTEVSNIINYKAYLNFSSMYRFENNADDEAGVNDGTNNGVTFAAKADDPANTPY